MNLSQIEKTLLWILRVGLGIALLAPLFYSADYFFPYIAPRAFFFQIVSSFLLAISVILMAFFPRTRPKWTFVSLAIALYFAIGAITTLTSADPSKSFIGTIERSFGFYHILHYGGIFIALSVCLQTLRQWQAFLAANIAVSLYATFDFLAPFIFQASGLRPSSIMGNPIFLAVYLTFNVFFAAYLIKQIRNKKYNWVKVFLYVTIGIEIIAILNTEVRGAFVGLSLGVLYLLFDFAWKHAKWRLNIIGLILILLVSYALIFINRDTDLLRKNTFVQRFTNFSFEDETIRARFSMWKMAFSGFKERPLLGWGRENYSLVFNSYFDSSFDKANVGEGWEDRTHNVFLDEVVYGGVIGLLAYLAILATAAFAFALKEPLFTALLISYVAQNLFGVDSLNSYLPFFIFLAFADFLWRARMDMEQKQHIEQTAKTKILAYSTGIVSIILIAAATYFFTIQPAQGNKKMHDTIIAIAQNNYSEFETNYKESFDAMKNFPPLKAELLSLIITSVFQNSAYFAQQKIYPMWTDKVVADFEILAKRNEAEQRWAVALAQILTQKSVVEKNVAFLDKADGIWKKLIKASPQRKLFIQSILRLQEIRSFLTGSSTTNAKK